MRPFWLYYLLGGTGDRRDQGKPPGSRILGILLSMTIESQL